MAKSIYELELNETIIIDEINRGGYHEVTSVTRVPGGWIYAISASLPGEREVALTSSSTFVPYHGEFKPSVARMQ